MTITTEFRYLHSILAFASHDEERYILCGVCLEIDQGQLNIIATDGKHIGIYRDESAEIGGVPDGTKYIIPRYLLEMMAAVETEEQFDEFGELIPFNDGVTITIDGDVVWLRRSYGGTEIAGKRIDGKYPKWKQVVPKEANKPIQNAFNGDLVSHFIEAANRLLPDAAPNLSISSAGRDRAMVFRFGANIPFLGVLMPLHNGFVSDSVYMTSIPEWAK